MTSNTENKGGEKMNNNFYSPDRTWKNVWIVLRSKKGTNVVLSCKTCPQGVSPKGKNYNYVMTYLCYFFGLWLPVLLYYFIIPTEWSKSNKIIMVLFITTFWMPISSILVFISFRFSKWIPTNTVPPMSDTGSKFLKNKGDGFHVPK